MSYRVSTTQNQAAFTRGRERHACRGHQRRDRLVRDVVIGRCRQRNRSADRPRHQDPPKRRTAPHSGSMAPFVRGCRGGVPWRGGRLVFTKQMAPPSPNSRPSLKAISDERVVDRTARICGRRSSVRRRNKQNSRSSGNARRKLSRQNSERTSI